MNSEDHQMSRFAVARMVEQSELGWSFQWFLTISKSTIKFHQNGDHRHIQLVRSHITFIQKMYREKDNS